MDEYKIPYFLLWNACTAAIEAIAQQNFGQAKELLLSAQQDAETAYIESGASEQHGTPKRDGHRPSLLTHRFLFGGCAIVRRSP